MRVLIVEDTETKLEQLIKFFSQHYSDAVIESAYSFKSGSRMIASGKYDVVILDMSMPTYDSNDNRGGNIRHFGGRDLLSKVSRKGPAPVIVITRFDILGPEDNKILLSEYDRRLQKEFPVNYKGHVFYDEASTSIWMTKLKNLLNEIGLR